MKTELINFGDIDQATALLKEGEVVAFPTETVFGLGADATNNEAVAKVFTAKNRPADNPLIVHVSGIEMLAEYAASVDDRTIKLIEEFWPGPLTIILQVKPNKLDKIVTGGLTTAAFRMPKNNTTLAIIDSLGKPLVGPSANISGRPSPTTAYDVYQDMKDRISGIIFGNKPTIGVESTVLDLTSEIPTIFRPGAVTAESLGKLVGPITLGYQEQVGANETPKSPGLKYRHYAPKAAVKIFNNEAELQKFLTEYADYTVGVMAVEEIDRHLDKEKLKTASLGQDLTTATQRLFKNLRELDRQKVDYILVQGFAHSELSEPYMNRLKKSAGVKN